LAEGTYPIAVITNAVDVRGRTASDYIKYFAEGIGRKVDLAIINRPVVKEPQSYLEEYHYWVEPDEMNCRKYADEVKAGNYAPVIEIDGLPTIRHNGEALTKHILEYLLDGEILKPTNPLVAAIRALRNNV